MAKDVYKINEEFLKAKGLELKPTGFMFTPYASENETLDLSYDEYANLHIANKVTGKRKTVNMVTSLLTENDLK